MFDVYGDEIVLDGIRVGRLEGGWPTLRQRAIDGLQGAFEDAVSGEDHADVVKDFEETIDGLRDELRELRDEKKEEHQGEIDAAFERGRDAALLESEHGQDVARVSALLASLNKVYALLQQGLAKPSRSPAVKEAQSTMRFCLLELHDAARRYKS